MNIGRHVHRDQPLTRLLKAATVVGWLAGLIAAPSLANVEPPRWTSASDIPSGVIHAQNKARANGLRAAVCALFFDGVGHSVGRDGNPQGDARVGRMTKETVAWSCIAVPIASTCGS